MFRGLSRDGLLRPPLELESSLFFFLILSLTLEIKSLSLRISHSNLVSSHPQEVTAPPSSTASPTEILKSFWWACVLWIFNSLWISILKISLSLICWFSLADCSLYWCSSISTDQIEIFSKWAVSLIAFYLIPEICILSWHRNCMLQLTIYLYHFFWHSSFH